MLEPPLGELVPPKDKVGNSVGDTELEGVSVIAIVLLGDEEVVAL